MYSFIIHLVSGVLNLVALFHAKTKLALDGRKGLFSRLDKAFGGNTNKVIWVHCASLGEFEQGRPIIEALKIKVPEAKILLTFFSPSGYEVRKAYPLADFIFYLPWDTAHHAKKFITLTKPSVAIFIKYEFWYNYSRILKQFQIPLISASSIFRSNQVFFKPYGGFFRSILKNFDHFFVQNPESKNLLQQIGIKNCTIAGDTRFDRVNQIITTAEEILLAGKFKNNEQAMVIGSAWPEDLDVLIPFMNEYEGKMKFILAPHEIEEKTLTLIEQSVKAKCVRYSVAGESIADAHVLLIDNIGMLSRLYRYGEFAYVGGSFGKGLHNILEAACYGIPIFFGNQNYQKFQEANELIMRGGAFPVGNYTELKKEFQHLINHPESYQLACEVTRSYVKENLGATDKIVNYCLNKLNNQYEHSNA